MGVRPRSDPRSDPFQTVYSPQCPSTSRHGSSAIRASPPTTTSSHLPLLRSPPSLAPGQFVMVKVGRGNDPLLRRPFSVFEVLRDGRADDRPVAAQQAHRRHDRHAVRRGRRATSCRVWDRWAARSRPSRHRPKHGWWPAASAWRRLPRSPRRCERAGTHARSSTALAAAASCSISTGSGNEASGWCSPPKTAASAIADASPCRSSASFGHRQPARDVRIYACGPEPMLEAVAHSPRSTTGRHRCRSSGSWVAGLAAATAV